MRILAVVGCLAVLAGCGHKKKVRVSAPVPPGRVGAPVPIGYTEIGVASWYGNPYHGRPAANGEIYDMEKMTAAHRTLPFNTWLRVYDLDTNKTTEVRVIDRGPFVGDRIVDLSRAAARELAMIGPGTARVRIEVIRAPEGVVAVARFAVQVGAYRDPDNAARVRGEMERDFATTRLVLRAGNPATWRVLVGDLPTEDEAGALAAKIREKSPEKNDCFVVRLDAN